jgi:hypothetical protein
MAAEAETGASAKGVESREVGNVRGEWEQQTSENMLETKTNTWMILPRAEDGLGVVMQVPFPSSRMWEVHN